MEFSTAQLDSLDLTRLERPELRLVGLAYASLGEGQKARAALRASLEGVPVPESPRAAQLQEKVSWDDADGDDYHAAQESRRGEVAEETVEDRLNVPLSEIEFSALEQILSRTATRR